MNENKKQSYKKLFRANVNFLGGNSVIRATDDHFLYTESSGYSEEYKRFFFSDIQAMKMVQKRDWAFIINAVILCFLICFLIAFVSIMDDEVGMLVFSAITMVLVIVAVYCLFAGAPVEVIIKTAYSNDKIMIGRKRRAEKKLRKMIASLEAVQNIPLDDAELYRLDEIEKVFRI